jgi:hypothetical protein
MTSTPNQPAADDAEVEALRKRAADVSVACQYRMGVNAALLVLLPKPSSETERADKAERRAAELEQTRGCDQNVFVQMGMARDEAEARAADLTRKVEAAAGALEPFAKVGADVDQRCTEMAIRDGGTAADGEFYIPSTQTAFVSGVSSGAKVSYGDFRRAREAHAALTKKDDGHGDR